VSYTGSCAQQRVHVLAGLGGKHVELVSGQGDNFSWVCCKVFHSSYVFSYVDVLFILWAGYKWALVLFSSFSWPRLDFLEPQQCLRFVKMLIMCMLVVGRWPIMCHHSLWPSPICSTPNSWFSNYLDVIEYIKPNVLLQSDQSTTFPQVALSDCSVHNACKHLRRYHRGSLSSACSQTWSVLHTLTYIDFLLKYLVQNLKEVIFVGENWVHLLIWFLLPCFRGLQCRLSHMHATLLIAPILLCLYNFGIS
jgi:hypothetical protein